MADNSGYHAPKGERFFPVTVDSRGRVVLRLEIQKRTLATARLMITQQFWNSFRDRLGEDVFFIWAENPQLYGDERLTLHEKPDGTGYFDLGWLKFYKRHYLKFGDILYLTYLGNNRFQVEKPCHGWLSPEREEIAFDPEDVLDLVTDEDTDEEIEEIEEEDDTDEEIEEEVVVIEDEPEQANPVVPRGQGRRRAPIDIPQGYDFGCAYPDFKDKKGAELGFSFEDASVLDWYNGHWEWNIHHATSDRIWKVKLHTYMSQKRHVFVGGWRKVQADLAIRHGDIVCFKLIDRDPQYPALHLFNARPF